MLINRLIIPLALLFLYSSVALAQTDMSDRCQVFVAQVTGKKPADARFSSARELGRFDTVVAEEELTTRTYRLPNTKLFVVASVWYTDESLASTKGADSISLQLMISNRPTRDVLSSLVYADAEMPVNGFDVGRVTTFFKTGNRTRVVIMECRQRRRE
jgi:hypothetical protein